MRRQKRSKRPFILLLSLIIMIFGSLYLFKGFFKKDNGTNDNNDNDNNIVENVKERSLTFTLAGNVLLNAEMWYDTASDGQYNFEYVFEDINNIMKKSNVNFYTQQGKICEKFQGVFFACPLASLYHPFIIQSLASENGEGSLPNPNPPGAFSPNALTIE